MNEDSKERRVIKLCRLIESMNLNRLLNGRMGKIYEEIKKLRDLLEDQWKMLDDSHIHMVRRLFTYIETSARKPDWTPEVQSRICMRMLAQLPRFGEYDGSHLSIFISTQDFLIEILARTWGQIKSEQQATLQLRVINRELERPATASLPRMLQKHIARVPSKERLVLAMKIAQQEKMCTRTEIFLNNLMKRAV